MADKPVPWNNLPTELLEAIGKRLKTKTDVSRFRAVCQSWRSSVPPFNHRQLHFPIRIIMESPENCFSLTISESIVYHLIHLSNINSDASAWTADSRDWVVKLREGEPGDQTRILHPLSFSHIKRLPKLVFPKVVNLLEFQVFELARIYTLYNSDHSLSNHRVAISFHPNWPAIMVVAAGKLYYCKLGTDIEKCTAVKDTTSKFFKDVICHEGKFYAVCQNGTAVVVDSSLEMTLIASPISPPYHGNRVCCTCLVESLGEILLVEANFKVYKLNAVERRWVETRDLGDRILCGGDNFCFSVRAEDFPGCHRNCIYFTDPSFAQCSSNYSLGRKFKIGVFNLSDRSILPLPFDRGCSNMFCPPSTWPMPS